MSNNGSKTPIWLELRKEYIDDNFDALMTYLKNKSDNQETDEFYQTTLDLLRQRVEELLNGMATAPVFAAKSERKQTLFNLRLLAVYLLTDRDSTLARTAYVAMMNELRTLHPRMSDRILTNTMKRLRHERVTVLGFNWSDLDDISTEQFAHNACSNAHFDKPLKTPLLYSNYGTAALTAEGICLTHENKEGCKKLLKEGVSSLETNPGISLRTKSADRFKQNQLSDLVEMDNWLKDFVLCQQQALSATVRALKRYTVGDDAVVRVVDVKFPSGEIYVETLDPAFEKLSGVIKWEKQSLVYYRTDWLYEFFEVGDVIQATVTDVAAATFSPDKQLVEFFVEDTRAAEEEDGSVFLCKLIDDRNKKYGWLNQYGIAFYSDPNPQYKKGDFALLEIQSYGKDSYYGLINASVCEPSVDTFDEKEVRYSCIRAFLEGTPLPDYAKERETPSELDPTILKLLLRQLFEHQKMQLKPSDRFRILANAHVMSELVGDKLAASFIRFESTYLRLLVQFVNGQAIEDGKLIPENEYSNEDSTFVRMSIVDLLKEYGKKENSEKLADAIVQYETSHPMLARLARLIQTSNSMQGTLSDAAINVIRHEIIKTLSIETEDNADLEAEGGIYLGIESGTVEFKTSMVFPPDPNHHMQAEELRQNQNILKGICAFLNSTTGGILYLGVNDQGYVCGIDNDMNHLHLQTIDSYLRYVQDTAKKYLGIDALTYIRIEPLYDNRVVAIHVEPHPYRLVELGGVAYLRVNAESREMPENVREEIIAQKVFKDKNKAATISLLQHACSERRCAVLHNYSSSHSGTTANRKVEPYDVKPEDNLLIALDYKDFKSKVFNLNRIGYVEVLKNEPWKYPTSHDPIHVDVFHMSGTQPTHIILQLDLMAKNLLTEEFPASKDYIKPHKGDENIWYFDTNVYSIEGIGRFYIGLAEHISILEGEPLKEFATQYIEKLKSRV